MIKLPKILIYSRFVAGPLLFLLSFIHISNYRSVAAGLVVFGFLSDIFDGIIARHLHIPPERLAKLDSTADEVFWLSVTAATYVQCKSFFVSNSTQLIILLAIESLTYIICFVKFRKGVAVHSISSKVWTLSIFVTLLQVTLTCNSSALFQVCFYIGIIRCVEVIGIILILRTWTNDVRSLYHAISIRNGEAN
ncbi:MAG TPA: CDP-alcohol phosphatidyltransferase family protein [Chitinophagaceae bacterium]